ncbi:MAG: M1 family metallopeptidase [Acidobacteriota bacterium]|nr:M1 family metallopeptidase [Acidobacteriota bacterium]
MAGPIPVPAQTTPQLDAASRANSLIGGYGPYRQNNDLLFYHLTLRVDPEKKYISGTNTIRFKMLQDGTRIQLELYPTLQIDGIEVGKTTLKYERDGPTVFVDFPKTLHAGHTYSIDFHYSGHPMETGRFGCFTFKKDTAGHPWINTACEETGAYVWWPNKDQWRDEPQKGMEIDVAVPNGLMNISNGRFVGKKDLGDGYTQWDWRVHYPINNYDVALNIGDYVHFGDNYHGLSLDYYVLPADLAKAKVQFAQVPGMMKAYYHYLGEYPFKKDGYKLIEVPYAGMEHQSAVAYGNHFKNGYFERDWTGVGISPRFDFIIIHESGHEWFGNSITAADKSDMWIHEGWTTYLESLYVEYNWGYDDALKYLNGLKSKVKNDRPIISARNANAEPPQDQYFKGALFINTLRSIVNDDTHWWAMVRGFYQTYKYQNIMTEDVVQYFNEQTGMMLTPIFDQYLRHTAIPTLELKFDRAGEVSYRWKVDEKDFRMPVRVGLREHWEIIRPTTEWQSMKTPLDRDRFDVATDLYYINVEKPQPLRLPTVSPALPASERKEK